MEKRYWPLLIASFPVASACSASTDRTTDIAATSSSLAVADGDDTVVPHLPATPTFSASTVPSNGDQNPYGVAFVPHGFPGGGPLHEGDILVANFNNATVPGMNGMQAGERSVNSAEGAAFGLALKENGDDSFELAAVDDVKNVLDAWIVKGKE